MEPECILYDEPTASLDPPRSRQIEGLIGNVNQKLGTTSVVVTHDMDSACNLADHVYTLDEGKIVFSGTPEELVECDDPVVKNFIKR